jgi:hypothetical protein
MRSRRIVGFLLCLIAVVAAAALAVLILDTYQHPEPLNFEIDQQGVHIRYSASRTRIVFPGDCIILAWGIDNAGEIRIAKAPVLPAGERPHCDGTPPELEIETPEGGTISYVFPRRVLFDQWYAWTLLLLTGLGAILGGMLLGIHRLSLLQRPAVQYALVFAFAVGWVFALDLFTNSLNIYRYVWDHYHYIDMAQNGIVGNEALVGPYAYRPAVPLLARFIAHFTERSVTAGFRIVTYGGLISQLVLVFVLARQFTRKGWVAWTIVLVIAFSTYNVKFLLFDIYRPDSLAFTLILIGMLAFVQRQRLVGTTPSGESRKDADVGAQRAAPLHTIEQTAHSDVGATTAQTSNAAQQSPPLHSITRGTGAEVPYELIILLTSVVGLFVREFCAIPAALLSFRLLLEFIRTRRPQPLIKAVGIVGIVFLVYWAPQKLIIVGRTDQLLNSDLSNLWNIVSNITRNFNILLGAAIYLLPLLALLTRERARRLWARLGDYRVDMALYMLIVAGLALVGGSDIDRFVVYLLVPLILALALLLDESIHPLEVVYALIATALYNRILAPVPQQSLEEYLDFYIVWHDRTSPVMWLRAGELLLWLAGALALRRWLHIGTTRVEEQTVNATVPAQRQEP